MIENKFIYFLTRNAFDQAQLNDEINPGSVVFVEDDSSIHTHGHQFSGGATDIEDKISKFEIGLNLNPSSFEFDGLQKTCAVTIDNHVRYFNSAHDEQITDENPNIQVSYGGNYNNGVWTLNTQLNNEHLPISPQTITYTTVYNGNTKSISKNVSLYLRKYFGFSGVEVDPDDPDDIAGFNVTALPGSNATPSVGCTITVPSTNEGEDYQYIYIAIPANMQITNIIQPDAQNAPFPYSFVSGQLSREILPLLYVGYKLYKSEEKINARVQKRLTIS